jgi:phosphoribosylamine--glycine ligase
MGTYSPVPFLGAKELAEAGERVLGPWLKGCQAEGIDFRGIIYPGIMLTKDGPKVLEFNARFGDPETQVYLTRLESDLLELLSASVDGTLSKAEMRWSDECSVCVVMASGGYPGDYAKGKVITGLEDAAKLPKTKVFHAGTQRLVTEASPCQQFLSSGGRVLGVTAWASTLKKARDAAYRAVDKIKFDGAQYRRDIAAKALTHTAQ